MSEHGWYSEGRKLAESLVDMWYEPQKLLGYLTAVINQYKNITDDGRAKFLQGVQIAIDEFVTKGE